MTNINEVGLEDIELMDEDDIAEMNDNFITKEMRKKGFSPYWSVYSLNLIDVSASLGHYLAEKNIKPKDAIKEIECIFSEMNDGQNLQIDFGSAFDYIFDKVFNDKEYRRENKLEVSE